MRKLDGVKNLRLLNDHEVGVLREALKMLADTHRASRWAAQSMLEQEMPDRMFWSPEEKD